jgi:hypothetical protein
MSDKPPTDTNPGVAGNKTLMSQLIAEIGKFGGFDKTKASQLARILLPHIDAALQEQDIASRLDTIKNLITTSGLYNIDCSYSRNQFYVVDKPDVDEELTRLQAKQQKGQQ